MARRRARELAFRTLFQAQRGEIDPLVAWEEVRADLAEEAEEGEAEEAYGDRLEQEDLAFADRLLHIAAERRDEIDARIEGALEGWTFGQMSQTDLNVLRLAVAEFVGVPEVPREVAIEMAVRTAKRFGGEESGRFVNGVLAKVHRSF